jgi:hypothetical protein
MSNERINSTCKQTYRWIPIEDQQKLQFMQKFGNYLIFEKSGILTKVIFEICERITLRALM